MRKLLLPTFCMALLSASAAQATTIDLTTANSTGTIGGALYLQGAQLSGTGVFPAFVQISGAGNLTQTAGYNTTENNVLNNASSDTFNHSITMGDISTVLGDGTNGTVAGTTYYLFLLDINESNAARTGDAFLSLDQLKIYTSTVEDQDTTPLPTSGSTLRYDMDGIEDSTVLLNYDLETGSGRADMRLLIPVSSFGGASAGTFVYLYSSFGALGVQGNRNYGTSDGFEEWALGLATVPPDPPDPGAVPEPGSMILLGSGLAGLAAAARRRRQKQ